MLRFRFAAAAVAVVAVAGCASSSSSAPASHHGYEPVLSPAAFTVHVTNPWFPLPAGAVWTYHGTKDGQAETDVVKVTTQTKVIEGVKAVGVSDISYAKGKAQEVTTDWYAQDHAGNVWYLGEDTAEGTDTSGTWAAGKNDGEPGIIMPAHPAVPAGYRQELSVAGGADDTAWVVGRAGPVTGAWGSAARSLVTLEYSRLEPGVVDRKVYGWGTGIVTEQAMSGPQEVWQLASLTR